MKRVCSPRATNGLPHVAHFGRSPSGFWLPSSVSPICTTSWISWARNWLIRSSTAASISAHVALGCSLRHWVIPSTSRSPALTCCICSLRSRLFFLAFMLSSLSWFFPVFYHPFVQKNETHSHKMLKYTLPFIVCYTTYMKFSQGDCEGTLAPWRLRFNVKYSRRTMA